MCIQVCMQYVFVFNMQVYASVYHCVHVVCLYNACLYNVCLYVKLWASLENLIRQSICCPEGRTPLRRLSLHSSLCCENLTDSQLPTIVSDSLRVVLSALSYSQTSSKPRHPDLTFLKAEDPRGIPADEMREMLKTAKLVSVTGNLQRLV